MSIVIVEESPETVEDLKNLLFQYIDTTPVVYSPNIYNEVLEVLRDGEGWYQGDARNHDGTKICLGQALSVVMEKHHLSQMAREGYSKTLTNIIGEQYPAYKDAGIAGWNDAPRREFSHVRGVLEKAAARVA